MRASPLLALAATLLLAPPLHAQDAADERTLAAAEEDVRAAREAGVCLDETSALEQRVSVARGELAAELQHRLVAEVARQRIRLRMCRAGARERADVLLGGPLPPTPRPGFDVRLDPASVTGEGDLDPATIVRAVRVRRSALVSCYERELRMDPALTGSVRIELTVEESGRVASVRAVETTVGEVVATCMTHIVRTLRFNPGPADGIVTLAVVIDVAPPPAR